jgi:hypothetical protein
MFTLHPQGTGAEMINCAEEAYFCAAVSIHPTTCCKVSELKNGSRGTVYINKKTQMASN